MEIYNSYTSKFTFWNVLKIFLRKFCLSKWEFLKKDTLDWSFLPCFGCILTSSLSLPELFCVNFFRAWATFSFFDKFFVKIFEAELWLRDKVRFRPLLTLFFTNFGSFPSTANNENEYFFSISVFNLKKVGTDYSWLAIKFKSKFLHEIF